MTPTETIALDRFRAEICPDAYIGVGIVYPESVMCNHGGGLQLCLGLMPGMPESEWQAIWDMHLNQRLSEEYEV